MFDDDEKTNPGAGGETEEERAIGAAADALGRIARDCEAGLRTILSVPPDMRGPALRKTVLLLGELAELSFEQRRILAKIRDFHYRVD